MSEIPENNDHLPELVRKAAHGDTGAFRILMHRFNSDLVAYLNSMTHCYEDAQDLAQEVWKKVFLKIHQCLYPKGFKGWLFRVARNLFLDSLRQKTRKANSDGLRERDEILHLDVADAFKACTIKCPLKRIEDAVAEWKKQLPWYKPVSPCVERCEAVWLFLAEVSPTQIAEALNAPRGSIDKIIAECHSRILAQLKLGKNEK